LYYNVIVINIKIGGKMDEWGYWLGGALVLIVIAAAISLVAAIPTLILWNWLMPTIFSLPKITFWQAWGLNWLVSIFFKSVSVLPVHRG
jgi:hypothetical protein